MNIDYNTIELIIITKSTRKTINTAHFSNLNSHHKKEGFFGRFLHFGENCFNNTLFNRCERSYVEAKIA